MMDDLVSHVAEFFRVHPSVGVKLPSGWFGRPYDNIYHLVSIDVEDNRLSLQFNDWSLLSIANPSEAIISGSTLRVLGFTNGIWEWRDADTNTSHQEVFDRGVVELIASSDS